MSAESAAAAPGVGGNRLPVALYVHFPFCLSICPYCDFVVVAGSAARGPRSRVAMLVDALVRELELRAPKRSVGLGSVYLGGGTPSLMSAEQVGRLLAAVDRCFGIGAGAEVTIEANPGAGERGDLAGFRAAGVNRLSIGAQSLDAAELRRIGRRHAPRDVAATMREARRAGFDNLSLDLLYDMPGQTVKSWRETLAAALTLGPEHVSVYALSLDDPAAEGLTGPFGDHLPLRPGARRWRERARAEQDDDRAADMYLLADEMLAAAGLDWYEISNWARPGRESRHNLVYWLGGAWEAVGPGAHAFDGGRTRRWNAASLERYLETLADGRLPPSSAEVIDPPTAQGERTILRLRTAVGLPLAGSEPSAARALDWGIEAGLLVGKADGRAQLTARGRLVADELFVRLLPD
ncbi:radical SAM family heme chaperone HemW [soil metagenome]